MRPASSSRLRPLLLAPLLGGLAGCASYGFFSFPLQARGAQVDRDQVAQLVPGTSTRQDVTALLGTPTTRGTFDDNTWIYVSQITRPVIAGTQGVITQHVFELNFDARGVLTSVASRDKKDALPVQVVARTTPSPGTNASILQQLLGNIGRFNPTPSTGGAPVAGGTNTPGNF